DRHGRVSGTPIVMDVIVSIDVSARQDGRKAVIVYPVTGVIITFAVLDQIVIALNVPTGVVSTGSAIMDLDAGEPQIVSGPSGASERRRDPRAVLHFDVIDLDVMNLAAVASTPEIYTSTIDDEVREHEVLALETGARRVQGDAENVRRIGLITSDSRCGKRRAAGVIDR